MNQARHQSERTQRTGRGPGLSCIVVSMLWLVACLGATGCAERHHASATVPEAVVAISGSDTMVNLAQMWAEEYGNKKPSVKVEVSGGGSGVGIRDLMQGVIQVANSSRELETSERDQIVKKSGKAPVETTVAYDGIAIYVHKDNPIETITLEQLDRIFEEKGDVSHWSQLGIRIPGYESKDKIIRVSRQNSSGTYLYFREHVLKKKDFKQGSYDMSGSKDVVEIISRAKTAIGYSGMGYATKDVKMLRIGATANAPGVAPTAENVTSKAYPLARALYMITAGEPDGETRNLLEWVLSAEGQKIVTTAGYVPVPSTR